MLDIIVTITLLQVVIVFIIMLYVIRPPKVDPPGGVRRHDGSGRTWSFDEDPLLGNADTVVIGQIAPEVEPRHASQPNVVNTVTVVNEPMHLSTGRHSVENSHRIAVPFNWMPPLGTARIALIDTPTSEYMVVRRQHTRVRDDFVGAPTGFVRKYVTSPDMMNV